MQQQCIETAIVTQHVKHVIVLVHSMVLQWVCLNFRLRSNVVATRVTYNMTAASHNNQEQRLLICYVLQSGLCCYLLSCKAACVAESKAARWCA